MAHSRGRSAMVIMFRRKDSKLSTNDEKDDRESFVSTSSTRTSNASMKVPMTIKTVNGGSVTIPEVPVAPPPDPNLDPAAYLRSIHSVRQRSRAVMKKAKRNQLNHFDIDFSKFADTAQYVASIIKVCGCLHTLSPTSLSPLKHRSNILWSKIYSGITPPIIMPYPPIVVGIILTLAGDLGSTNSYNHGLVPLTRLNGLGD